MALPYYNATQSIRIAPSSRIREDLQTAVTSDFRASSSFYAIEEELTFGTLVWSALNARVNHVAYSDTGEKLGDDFKSLIFDDFDQQQGRGYRYRFDDNVWLTINSDLRRYVTASVVIRRCNQVLKFRDENGALVTEPCFQDYGLTNDKFGTGRAIIIPNGERLITAQKNDITSNIRINDRFLFGGQAFKVQSFENSQLNTTFGNNDAPLITWRMVRDELRQDDDVANNIADNTRYSYTINIDAENFSQTVGYTTDLDATVKLNGEIVTRDLTWASSEPTVVSIDGDGNIEVLSIGTSTISVSMTDNATVTDSIVVEGVSVIAPTEEIRISPDNTRILQTDTQIYTVYKYENDVQQADTFTFSVSGANSANYEFTTISGNSFSVRNIERDSTALTVLCTDDIDSSTESIDIELGGLW